MLVLQDLHASAPAQLRWESSDEAAHDYCWSALVLSAAFGFRVSPGHDYYLYYVASVDTVPHLPKSWVIVSQAHSLHGVNCVTI